MDQVQTSDHGAPASASPGSVTCFGHEASRADAQDETGPGEYPAS